MNLSAHILKIAKAAKKASFQMALISAKEKNHALMQDGQGFRGPTVLFN